MNLRRTIYYWKLRSQVWNEMGIFVMMMEWKQASYYSRYYKRLKKLCSLY